MNILLKGWGWNYIILWTLRSVSSFAWLTHPIILLLFLRNSVCPAAYVQLVVHGSVSLFPCTVVSPFCTLALPQRESTMQTSVCYQPSFQRIQGQPFLFPCRTGILEMTCQLPARKHAPLRQPAAQTNCFPSCVTPVWNRGKCEYSKCKPDTRARKALDNFQFKMISWHQFLLDIEKQV